MIFVLFLLTQLSGGKILPVEKQGASAPELFHLTEQTLKPFLIDERCLSISKDLACFSQSAQEINIVYFNGPQKSTDNQSVPDFLGKNSGSEANQILFCRQRSLNQPFIATKSGIWIFQSPNTEWIFLPRKPVTGFTYPGSDFSGKFETSIQFPYLISLHNQKVLSYYSATGKWTLFDAKGMAVKKGITTRKAKPIRVGKSIVWLNLPEKETCKVSGLSDPLNFKSSLSIPELSRYSLIQHGTQGFWVISFPIGFRSALNAWDTGRLTLWVTFVSEENGLPRVNSQKVYKAPLNFELTVSRSGSPKLKASPAFEILPVNNAPDLALRLENNIILISSTGKTLFKTTSESRDLILLEKHDHKLRAWRRDGSNQLLNPFP